MTFAGIGVNFYIISDGHGWKSLGVIIFSIALIGNLFVCSKESGEGDDRAISSENSGLL